MRLIEVPAPRGVIKDTNGTLLVQNRGSVVITINRQELGDQTERVLFDLSELLDIPADELGARLDDPRYYVFSPIPVATDVPKRVAYYIEEHTDGLPRRRRALRTGAQVPPGLRGAPTSSGTSARSRRTSSRIRGSPTTRRGT